MNELKIEVKDTLTRSSCSKLVIKIIKHILYNTQQIPVNYELLSRFIKHVKRHDPRGKENETGTVHSLKKKIVQQFFNKVHSTYNDFEDTFKNLEQEFLECSGLEEVVIMIGSTILMPKKLFRIEIPKLLYCNCGNVNKFQSNLMNVFRCMINSDNLHSYLSDNVDPMNVFILLKRVPNEQSKCGWLLPKDNFRIPKVKQLVIKFEQPEYSDILCTSSQKCMSERGDGNISQKSEICDTGDSICWYQNKLSLKGFKDQKVEGVSAFNFFKDIIV